MLEKRAEAVVAVIYYATEEFLKDITGKTKELKGIRELKRIGKQEKNLIAFFVSISFLFQAQKFFWERIIKNRQEALNFERAVYDCFEKTANVNPKPYISDIGKYIKERGREGEVMYLGNKICRELGKSDIILSFSLNAPFCSILIHWFFKSLKKAWEIKNE